MHIQASTTSSASPADLEKLLRLLAEPPGGQDPINIEGVSGAHIETGGKFVFSFDHDRRADVEAILADYRDLEIVEGNFDLVESPPSLVANDDELHVRVLEANTPGALLAAIQGASSVNLPSNRLVRHVLIGQETQEPHRFYVQIRFQEVKRA
jgi:hypothetical protein